MALPVLTLLLWLLPSCCSGAGESAAAPAPPLRVWHITDVHIDPWFTPGADATSCYCEITKADGVHRGCDQPTTCSPACNCSLASHGGAPNTPNGTAGLFGNSEGNCATPVSLYASAVEFMRAGRTGTAATAGAPLVYFTGDFAEAGSSYPCDGTVNMTVAQQQINSIISHGWLTLRVALPNATILGTLGNHDASPGDVVYGDSRQSWLYDHCAALWAPDLQHEPGALASVRKGGWFATRPVPGLTVISLNINYWCDYILKPMDFVLKAMEFMLKMRDSVPRETQNPQTADPTSSASKLGVAQFTWLEAALGTAVATGDKVHILGHQPPGPNPPGPGDPWVAGAWPRLSRLVERYRAHIQGLFFGHVHTDEWTLLRGCTGNGTNASVPGAVRCDGAAHTLLLPGVSLTEGFPATNPALRLLEFDPVTFALREAWTYYADLHAANAAPQRGPQWRLAYQFTREYGLADLSVDSFERLHAAFAQPGSKLWDKYHGKAGGIYCTFYDVGRSPFPPLYPCTGWPDGAHNPDPRWPRGVVPMKDAWIAKLNATNLLA